VSSKESVLTALESDLRDHFETPGVSVAVKGPNITRWKTNYLTTPQTQTPAITIIDAGESIPEVQDAVNVRYLSHIHLQILVKLDTKEDALTNLNAVVAEIQKFADDRSLSDGSFVHIRVAAVDSYNLYPDRNMADCIVSLHLRYIRAKGAV
jgi:hypothetical protein